MPQHSASEAVGAQGVHNSAKYGTVRYGTGNHRFLPNSLWQCAVRGGGGWLSEGEGSARTLRARLSAKRLSRRIFKLATLPSPCAMVLSRRRSPSCAHQPPAAR
jgi:hypothetical protein